MLLNLTVQYVRHPHSSLLYILFLWWELRVLWGRNSWHYRLILGTQCYSQYTEEKLQHFKVNWMSQIKKEKSEKMSSSSALAENIVTKILQTYTCEIVIYLCAVNLKEQKCCNTCMEPLWRVGSTKFICFEWMKKTTLRERGSPKAHDPCVYGIDDVQ